MYFIKYIVIANLLFSTLYAQETINDKIVDEVNSSIDDYIRLYEHLHTNPELSFKEFNTSKRMVQELQKIGFEVTPGFGGNNVVGVYKNGTGPVIMMRTDMDALPIEEKTDLPFASKVKMKSIEEIEYPVMHACGHDMHMSVFIATANTLVKLKKYWSGTLVFIAQQAEEYSGGSNVMINEGLFQKFPTPDYILAYHVSAELPAGTIGFTEGATFASVSTVNITFNGIGGHGALPHTTVDPIVMAAKAILDYQTIISREISPMEPAVITVGSIHGGTKNNIIPDKVELELTVRSFNEDVMAHILSALKRKSESIALSAGLPEQLMPVVNVLPDGTPSVVNNNELLKKCVKSFRASLGEEKVIEVLPATVSEDFARYGLTDEKIPICLTWLGSVNQEKYMSFKEEGKDLPALHSSNYFPDAEPTIRTGANAMVHAIIDLMNK